MDGSEAAVTATTTTSYPNMNNHVYLHDQPSCKSLKPRCPIKYIVQLRPNYLEASVINCVVDLNFASHGNLRFGHWMLTIEIEYVLEIVNTVWATPNTIELNRVTSVTNTKNF